MASTNGTRRTVSQPRNGQDPKGNKFANAGAAAGGFLGGLGGSLTPPLNITINNNKGGQQQGVKAKAQSLMPPPEFWSPAQTRDYCNSLRAAAVALSIEVAMGAEILNATLSQVPDPEGKAFGSKIRAQKVARKMRKAASALQSAAKNAAACYAVYTQEFEQEINAVRQRAKRPERPRMNWADQ
ncbi:plasmid transfer protein TraA [Streptomyces sp. WAC08401]|uniref:plasmid transfer protein TraA n=1 Tax=unclassified Streptomyces TaxID=2593676 RepID=UPI000F989F72|nr:plasmid transfer protein TraA [Streptomyces sp. WAC08401]RSS16633.1 sporulation protein SsgA [Streptomyces sp. WAC08401]